MSLKALLDPFAQLTQPLYEQIWAEKRRNREAEARFQRLLSAHKLLLQDTRYQVIAKDAEAILGTELQKLVLHASKCGHCGPKAERIRLLTELVTERLQMVWTEAHRPKQEVEHTELPPELDIE